MSGKDGASNIDIWLRVKPGARPSQRLVLDPDDGLVQFNMPRELSAGYVNNQRENYEFRFNGILTPQAKQDEVNQLVWTCACQSEGAAACRGGVVQTSSSCEGAHAACLGC